MCRSIALLLTAYTPHTALQRTHYITGQRRPHSHVHRRDRDKKATAETESYLPSMLPFNVARVDTASTCLCA